MDGRAPRTVESCAAAAGHHTAAVAGADDKCGFEHGGINDDAVRFVNEALRNIVRNVHDFLQNLAGTADAVLICLLCRAAREDTGVTKAGRPINTVMSRAERIRFFMRCTLLWVEHHHMDFACEPQHFSGLAASIGEDII